MAGITRFLKRHSLWLAFLASFAALVVLLALQYGWLVRLEEASAIAQKATLNNYLEAVATEVEFFYRSNAERALNLPASLLTQNRFDKIAHILKAKDVKGAKRVFVMNFAEEGPERLSFFNPDCPSMEAAPWDDEAKAIFVATAPWALMSKKGGTIAWPTVSVDERDPSERIVLNPITDEASKVVGVAGLIADETYFRDTVLPGAIQKSLPAFFSEDARSQLLVTVRDGKGTVQACSGASGKGEDHATRKLSFIFTDWKLGLRSGHAPPEQFARSTFALNLTLAAIVGLFLIGAVAIALRMASREMRLSQMKSDFVSNVSHELRTPISSIRVFGEFMKLGRVPSLDKVQEYGEYIEGESRRLTQLIDNILDFSRIESGRKIYTLEEVDLAEIVRDTLRTFDVRLKQEGFSLSFQGPAEPIPPVQVDRGAISQALSNLLDNAVKYSNGAREIGVTLTRENGSVLISVRDHGVGISHEEQKKIFERFHRVSTGLVHDVKGSGLGLSIVSHIVGAHSGRVAVESEPGRGSTFTIMLPAPAPAQGRA